ncbi:MAG: hypothetical protein IPN71_10960 [Fibrobacteres bacterium]|nr:hypothetical protein [Fibrobacterota bacterium]
MGDRASLSATNYSSSVECTPAIKLYFTMATPAGCHPIAKFVYEQGVFSEVSKHEILLANRSIESIALDVGPSSAHFRLEWTKPGRSEENSTLRTFNCEKMNSRDVDRYLDWLKTQHQPFARNATVTIKLRYYPFFEQMIDCLTRNEEDTFNLADPKDESKFRKTVDPDSMDPISYRTSCTLKEIPALVNVVVTTPTGKESDREYLLEVRLFAGTREEAFKLANLRRTGETILMAGEYSHFHDGEMRRLRAKIEARNEDATSEMEPRFKDLIQKRKITWFGFNAPLEDLALQGEIPFHWLSSPLFPNQMHSTFAESAAEFLGRELSNKEIDYINFIQEIEESYSIQESNINRYIMCRTNLDRGKAIELEIIQQAMRGRPQRQVLIDRIRDGIDKKLIPLNAWHQLREDPIKEKHQNLLMRAFSWMADKNVCSSPIQLIRQFLYKACPAFEINRSGETSINLSELLDLVKSIKSEHGWRLYLQWGVGNCSEHAHTSYHALKSVKSIADSCNEDIGLKNIILSGQAFGDHGFVLGGFSVTTATEFETRPGNFYWDLAKEITKLPADESGFVVDPYLQETRRMTVQDFLNFLAHDCATPEERENVSKLHWIEQWPAPEPKFEFTSEKKKK